MKSTLHIVFAGGGTCGHLFPGLAVAEKLSANRPGVRITFVGTDKPLERRHVAAAGFDYVPLPSRPLPRRASEAISFVVENVAGYFAAGRLLDDENVAGVVGLGGYASVPMGRAAAHRRLPLVLLEQNVVLGKANRWLSRFASLVCTSFAQTERLTRWCRPVRCTGNPIRSFGALSENPPSADTPSAGAPKGTMPTMRAWCATVPGGEGGYRSTAAKSSDIGLIAPHPSPLPQGEGDQPRLVVLGGSGGARSLNENVPRALYKIRHLLTGWEILHQSGEADVESTRDLYRKFALEARVAAFWPDLPLWLAGSSLAICRAGGTTLAELSAAGTPAVLLPYPHATDDHQRKNADVFLAAGAARVLDEREITGRLDDQLAELLMRVLGDASSRATMAHGMRRIARPHAAAHAATLIWSLVSSQPRTARQKAAA
jgi:UDP-N-acetylglucosamine--N-acetylmuramyl-(pentapeptide) pyrophosphoryl-undecaprenol N-acetylglucosamine transferase